jgi:predicted ester cyclase
MSVERNKAVVRRFLDEVWNLGKLDVVDEIFAEESVLHYRTFDFVLSRSQVKEIVREWLTAFPDFHFNVAAIVGEGDLVACRIPFTGTHQGQLWDLAPTGRAVRVSETMFYRIANGLIVEGWEDYDELSMREQIKTSDAAPRG